ncbi:MAG: hypothetical protein EYC62_04810 [Alphaproteobacteria bacterium]|nr:MAG: hypothetical protein EYC62_04810 [Alphaproteobacteria bacterium]
MSNYQPRRGSKTDLRLPGQKVVMDGQLSRFRNLFGWEESQGDSLSNDNGKKRLRKIAPSDSDEGNIGSPRYVPPALQAKISEQGPGVFRKARELILRIGRPRQP